MAALSHPHTGAMVALMAGVPFNPVNGSCPACVQVPDLTGCTIPTLPISHCWRVLVLVARAVLLDPLLLLVLLGVGWVGLVPMAAQCSSVPGVLKNVPPN